MRFALPLFVLLVLVVVLAIGLLALRRRATEEAAAIGLVDQVRDLAWDHDELDPELCGAVLDRLGRSAVPLSVAQARAALDDVLTLARAHRETSPQLATILIDTIRNPKELR